MGKKSEKQKYTYRSLVKRGSKSRKGKGKKKAPSVNLSVPENTEDTVNSDVRTLPPDAPGTSKVFAPLKNISKEKIANSSFAQLENTPTKLKKTRVNTAKLGLRTHTKQHAATGYKLMDMELLQENLASFASCGKCKISSCLQIVTDPSKKNYGLAEN